MKRIFSNKDYKYKRKFINACILRIRFGRRKLKTIEGFKTFIFKAMKEIVHKNIINYLNLLNGSPCREIPEYNEVLSECYIVFVKCLEKFKVTKYNNFYFYYNKALSRNFYRLYQKEINFPSVELSEEMSVVHPKLSDNSPVDGVSLLLDNLHLEKLEREICESRLRGERGTEFIKRKKGKVNQKQYNDALKNVRAILTKLKEKGEM